MPATDPFLLFTRKFRELGIPYMVSGGVAAIFYGEPRLTNDVDIVVFLKPEDVSRIGSAFPLEQFYCPPAETIQAELGRTERGHFNLIHHGTGFKADLYLSGSDPLHAWALSRARTVDFEGEALVLAPPEYVMVRKLQFYREGGSAKHLRDIQRMLLALGPGWGRSEMDALAGRLGLNPDWEAAKSSAGGKSSIPDTPPEAQK